MFGIDTTSEADSNHNKLFFVLEIIEYYFREKKMVGFHKKSC